MDWRIQTPARLDLGPSQAGKSAILLKLVKDDSVWDRKLAKVIYCCPTLSDRAPYITKLQESCDSNDKQLLCLEKLPTTEEIQAFGEGLPVLLLADDLLAMDDPSRMKDLTLMDSHHLNVSVLFCVQTPFYKSSDLDLALISRNLTGRLILFQAADVLQYKLVSSRLFPERKSFLLECLSRAKAQQGLNYVYCNVHCFSSLPRKYMCYTALFTDERVDGSPLFFVLNK